MALVEVVRIHHSEDCLSVNAIIQHNPYTLRMII